MEVTDLPEPDSPTMHNVFPGCASKSTPRTARTLPASDGKVTVRSRTDNRGAVEVFVNCRFMLGLRNLSWGR